MCFHHHNSTNLQQLLFTHRFGAKRRELSLLKKSRTMQRGEWKKHKHNNNKRPAIVRHSHVHSATARSFLSTNSFVPDATRWPLFVSPIHTLRPSAIFPNFANMAALIARYRAGGANDHLHSSFSRSNSAVVGEFH